MLGFHDPAVPPCHPDNDPVAKFPGVGAANEDAKEGREIGEADHGGGEVVGFTAEDEGGCAVEDVEPLGKTFLSIVGY